MLEAHEPPCMLGIFVWIRHYHRQRDIGGGLRMRETAEKVVKGCPLCQSDATKKCRDQGPLRPILASAPWEVVTIDFRIWFRTKCANSSYGLLCCL